MSRKALNPVRQWLLKSVPLDLLIAEWLKVRQLTWVGEDQFPPALREQAASEAFLLREGGDLLGDRRRLHLGLVCSQSRSVTRSERLLLLEELRDYLERCGRRPEEYEFLRPTRFRLGRMEMRPLFFVLWSPDAPLLERLLAGKSELPDRIREDRYTFRDLLQEQAEEASSSARPGTASKNDEAGLPFGPDGIGYRIVGSSRGQLFRKMFVRLAGDRLFLIYISSEERLKAAYVTALIDGLSSAAYPVYRLEDLLLNHPPSEVRISVLEGRRDGSMELLNYRHEHVLIRDGELHSLRPQSGRNLHIQRWQMRCGDRLFLIPSSLTSTEKLELQEVAGQWPELDALNGWLDTKGVGRTLLLFQA